VAVTLRVVIIGVDHDLASQGHNRNGPVILQGHRNDNNISRLGRLDGGGCAGFRPKLCDEDGQVSALANC